MDDFLKKLYYKGQERISVIEAPGVIKKKLDKRLTGVQIDTFIDPRFLYDFILIFVKNKDELDNIGPKAIHNLSPDGKLWIAFHKCTSRKYSSEVNKDKGWEYFEQAGYKKVSQIVIDKDWCAMRLRNKKFIKSKPKED
jgi:hypothetical protein